MNTTAEITESFLKQYSDKTAYDDINASLRKTEPVFFKSHSCITISTLYFYKESKYLIFVGIPVYKTGHGTIIIDPAHVYLIDVFNNLY